MNTKNTLTINWKPMQFANHSIKEIITSNKIYDTVENQQILGKLGKQTVVDLFKHKEKTRIIIGESRPTVKKSIDVEKKTETFKNIKTLKAVENLLSKRNKDNIQSVVYKGKTIYEAPIEELV